MIPIIATTHKLAGLFELVDYPVAVHRPPPRDPVARYLDSAATALANSENLSARLLEFAELARQRLDADYAGAFRDLWNRAQR